MTESGCSRYLQPLQAVICILETKPLGLNLTHCGCGVDARNVQSKSSCRHLAALVVQQYLMNESGEYACRQEQIYRTDILLQSPLMLQLRAASEEKEGDMGGMKGKTNSSFSPAYW